MNPNSSPLSSPDLPSSAGEPLPPQKRPTRRQVIFGAAGAAIVLGVGIPTALATLTRPGTPGTTGASQAASPGQTAPLAPAAPVADGLLVPALLAAHPFTAAHRGGSRDWPEMSLLAYRNSVAAHVNALEMSLARTSDGVWFGLHDATLDRTSGTTGFVAAEHTWAEVERHKIRASLTLDHSQSEQPYLKFETLVKEFGSTHTIFVDPKATDSRYFAELLQLMAKLVANPTKTFIAKSYCTGRTWAGVARAAGYTTWGFYYGKDLDSKPGLLELTQDAWSLLGLDFEASDTNWAALRATGKPIVGHIIPSKAAEKRVLREGAQGLMISGVREVLG